MPIRRLALPEAGFEVSWDAEALEVVLDTSDERLAEAISSFVDSPPAAALLLVSVAGRGEEGRAGEPPFIFLATDRTPTTPDAFATWDWCAVTSRYAARCVERHGATQVMGYQEYWQSFPMLQLAWVSPSDDPSGEIETSVAYLFTPQQTLTLALDTDSLSDPRWHEAVSGFVTSFHLLPREREGRRRQAHVLLRGPFFIEHDTFVDVDPSS
jgi:hypothetical protein